MKRIKIGEVGVDSGQLIVCDPCYIDSEWAKVDFQDIRMYKAVKGGRIFKYESFWEKATVKASQMPEAKIEVFPSFEDKTSTGKTMNEMIADKDVMEMDVPEKKNLVGSFSYAGICESNNVNQHQINYKLGHPGVAVAFNSGLGDGVYPVYGYFEEGRCWKVEIDMGLTDVQKEFIKTL